MHFISSIVLLAVLIARIKTEAANSPSSGSGVYKDAHEYLQVFHHGQHHGAGLSGASEGGSSPSAVGQSLLNSQIQDQTSIVSQDQVPHSSAVPPQVAPIVGSSIIPPVGLQYVPQKSEYPVHFGGRAIGSPLPYYPYYGKTYASPYYSQYQPAPYQGTYPQSFYPYQQYSASPYAAVPYSAAAAAAAAAGAGAAASPYSSPVTPYSSYPYNYPSYIPQYYPGYPSAASYYQSSGEIQSGTKQ